MKTNGLRYSMIAAATIGILIVFNKAILNNQVDPYEYIAWTFIFAFIFCIFVYRKHLQAVRSLSSSDLKKLVFTGILTFGVAQILNILGQKYTSAINAGFLMTLSSLFTIPFAKILVNEQVPIAKLKFVGLIFGGIYLLSVGLRGISFATGDLLIIGSALILGFSNAYVRLLSKTIDFQRMTIVQLAIGSLFLYVSMYVFTGLVLPSSEMLGIYVVSGFLTMVVASSIFRAITLSGPIRAMLVIETYPIIAVIGSILFLGEGVSLEQVIGGVLIMTGIYMFIQK